MPHLSTLCGTIAMLVARFITAPACADPVKFDDISDDNDALSDALLVTPDRVTPLSGANMFATMPGQRQAITRGGKVTLNSLARIHFTSNAGGQDGEPTSVTRPADDPPRLGSRLERNQVESGDPRLGCYAQAVDYWPLPLLPFR